ncbi:unnamed protein product [Alopecurus aequalis]
MAPRGVELAKRNKMVIFCALAVLMALLMATQTAATTAGSNQGAARRLLPIWKCQYRNCNCRTCSIFGWACCGACCPAP